LFPDAFCKINSGSGKPLTHWGAYSTCQVARPPSWWGGGQLVTSPKTPPSLLVLKHSTGNGVVFYLKKKLKNKETFILKNRWTSIFITVKINARGQYEPHASTICFSQRSCHQHTWHNCSEL